MKKGISILGSTGSIGKQALDVIESFPTKFSVVGLAAKGNLRTLEAQIKKFSPRVAFVEKEEDERRLVPRLGRTNTVIYFGESGLEKVALHKDANILVVAIPGARALLPTLKAIKAGRTIALASKEILVAAGDIVMDEALRSKARILPLDSEHSAILQCLKSEDPKKIKKLILTASGGPFLRTPLDELPGISPEKALAHPTWQMGRKVTIDSATLMNKGFEVIEAHHLFGVPYSKIEVVVHPQSIIHSMVEFTDGSLIAQMSAPDMRLPIQYALIGLERAENNWKKLSFSEGMSLSFEKVDEKRFPLLSLAYEAGGSGGTFPAVLSAADEAAVEMFLAGKIKFGEIFKVINSVLKKHEWIKKPTIEDIIEADRWAKEEASQLTA